MSSSNNGSDNNSNDDKRGTFYWFKPDSLRVKALNDPSGKKNLGSRTIPMIKLRGMWLTRVGFEVVTEFDIEFGKDCLILRPVTVD